MTQADATRPAGSIERFDPETAPSPLMAAEHMARYRMARTFAPGCRVLDAGCGTGYGSALLAAAGATEVVGVDIDAPSVTEAAASHGTDHLRFAVGNLLFLDDDLGQFDLVVCFETLEHLADPAGALSALHARLRPGGTLICSVPNAAEEAEDNPFHLVDFDLDKISALLHAEFPWATVAVQTRGAVSILNTLAGESTAVVDVPLLPEEPPTAFIGFASDGPVALPPASAVATSGDDLRYWIARGLASTGARQDAHEQLERGYRDLEVALDEALAAAAARLEELGRVQRELAVARTERDTHARRATELTRELVASSTILAESHEAIANLRSRLDDLERQRTEETAQRDRREDELDRRAAVNAADADAARAELRSVQSELEAVRSTVSWRLTGGLRSVRRLLPGRPRRR